MEREERAARDLLGADEVRDVVPTIVRADETIAFCVKGIFVIEHRRFREINATAARESDAAAAVVRRHRAIKRIHALFRDQLYVLKMADTQKMPRLFLI